MYVYVDWNMDVNAMMDVVCVTVGVVGCAYASVDVNMYAVYNAYAKVIVDVIVYADVDVDVGVGMDEDMYVGEDTYVDAYMYVNAGCL